MFIPHFSETVRVCLSRPFLSSESESQTLFLISVPERFLGCSLGKHSKCPEDETVLNLVEILTSLSQFYEPYL